MKAYIYSNETGRYVDIITGDTSDSCERQFDERWESNDYSMTYSPGMEIPEIGDKVTD